MGYKKLVSLLAVSTLALAACDMDMEEEPTDPENGEVDEGVDENGADENGADDEASSSDELIDDATEQSGDSMPEYGLEIMSGTWTEEGYYAPAVEGEVMLSADILTEHEDYYVYVLEEDGEVVERVESEPEIEYTIDEPEEETTYVMGVSPDDLGEEGDTVETEDLYRYENVIAAPADEEAEEDETEG